MESSRQQIQRRQQANSSAISIITNQLKHPKTVTIAGLWLFGLFALFLAPAPSRITQQKLDQYNAKLRDMQDLVKDLSQAERVYMDARIAQDHVKSWFWRFRAEQRQKVLAHQPAVDKAYAKVRRLQKQRDSILRDAKSSLGLWSEAGVEESRELLWSNFQSGKIFAQRQTFWDAIFTLLDRRDKDWFIVLIQVLMSALANYTVGAVISIFMFILSLPSFLWSFNPSWTSATLFFAVAVIAALSLIATYLLLIYAAGAAVVVSTATFVDAQRRRIGGGYQQGPSLEGYRYRSRRGDTGRPHFE